MKKRLFILITSIYFYNSSLDAIIWQKELSYLEEAIQKSDVEQTGRHLTLLSSLTSEQKAAYINLAQDVARLRLAHMPSVSRSWFTTLGVLGFMSCIIPKIILPDIPLFSTLLNLGLLSNFCLVMWGRSREQNSQKKRAHDQFQQAAQVTALLMQAPTRT